MKRKAPSVEVAVESRTRSPRRRDGTCRAQGWEGLGVLMVTREALSLELRVTKSQAVEEAVRAGSSPTGPCPTYEGLCRK